MNKSTPLLQGGFLRYFLLSAILVTFESFTLSSTDPGNGAGKNESQLPPKEGFTVSVIHPVPGKAALPDLSKTELEGFLNGFIQDGLNGRMGNTLTLLYGWYCRWKNSLDYNWFPNV